MKLALKPTLHASHAPRATPPAALALAVAAWLGAAPEQARAQWQAQAPAQQIKGQQGPETRVPAATLEQAVRLARDAALAAAPAKARVTAEAGHLDFRLALAPCNRIETYLPPGGPSWGVVRVGLRCAEGATRWNVFLPVTVQVVAPAIVVTTQLPAGAQLEAGHLRRVEVEWSAAPGALFDNPNALIGRLLARAITSGQPVQAAHLQARQWFAQGDTVRIIAGGPGFQIISEGQALTAGQEGRPARVQTESGRILTGRPVSDRCLEVSL